LYPAADEIREGYRRSVCGVDTIYYRVVDDAVEIMAIIGRQDTVDWLSP
jgi:toxin ParE1/3/4